MVSSSSKRNSVGFPLLLVGVVIIAWGLLLTQAFTGVFPFGTALSVAGDTQTVDLSRVSELLGNDLKRAEETSLLDGAGWAPSLTLSWKDRFRGVPVLLHVVQYTLDDDRLMRSADGSSKAVAEDVLSAGYSIDKGQLNAVFEVRAESGRVETVNLRIGTP